MSTDATSIAGSEAVNKGSDGEAVSTPATVPVKGEGGGAGAAGGGAGPAGLSPELERLIAEKIAAGVADGVKAHLSEREGKTAVDAARSKVIAEDLKGIPDIYLGMLGTDPAKFKAETKAIRERVQADLAGMGIKAAPLSSDAGGSFGGLSPTALPGNPSTGALLEQGLQEASAQRPRATVAEPQPEAQK